MLHFSWRHRVANTENSSRRRGRVRASALTTVLGAAVVALACVVALPAHAQAATVAWSTQKPAGACGPARSISTGRGYAHIKDCLKIARSASGTYYYNGVLEVEYHRAAGYVGDVLGGKSMIVRRGDRYALGVNDCPRERWIYDRTRWCYSPTKSLPRGQRIYGKGVLLDYVGRWYPPVWSKTLTTYRLNLRAEADSIMGKHYNAFITFKRTHHPQPFDWHADGCSIPRQISKPLRRPLRRRFDKPCQLHDFGYRNYGRGLRLGRNEHTRAWIDRRLLREMRRLCHHSVRHPRLCKTQAVVIYRAVRVGGKSSFYR